MKKDTIFIVIILLIVMATIAIAGTQNRLYLPMLQNGVQPTITPIPTATPTQRPLPDACRMCYRGDQLNCTDFISIEEAQSCLDRCKGTLQYDPHNLDDDRDGLACNAGEP